MNTSSSPPAIDVRIDKPALVHGASRDNVENGDNNMEIILK